ncbi:hypothetical protein TCAL_07723 [Tigriopus californicus]|uniref:Hexosyltransferase n=1 Tax=Tigriopus californicus TaxID=6832 RepID=A0A553PJS7_TIGCA|nr:hypothetical protein TCAL_07723 [Tigriopus californicus]
MVVSDPDNFQERLDIRLTWGLLAGRLNMPVVFVIGRPDQHETSMNDLLKEQKDWKDLLLMDMVDTYKNLTLKSAAILSYIHHFDIDTRFVVKARVVRTKTPFGIKHMPNAVPNPASLCQNLNERKILIRSHFASFKQIHKRINKSNWWWSLAYNCGFKFE